MAAATRLQVTSSVEGALASVQADLGMITSKEAELIKIAIPKVSLSRVQEIEAEIHHDLMAVVKALSEQSGDAAGKVHLGATSNDIQDTVLSMQLVETRKIILDLIVEYYSPKIK